MLVYKDLEQTVDNAQLATLRFVVDSVMLKFIYLTLQLLCTGITKSESLLKGRVYLWLI